MSALIGPRPDVGRQGDVVLNGIPLMVQPGSWKVEEPQRFGDKLSIGALKYTDFNPFESAQAFAYLTSGYGLQRYSDIDTTTNTYSQFTTVAQASSMYKEAHNVDARFGPVILSYLQTTETLPGSTTPPIWAGEFTPTGGTRTWVVVTQRRVYTRAGGGTWTDTGIVLPADAVRGAVGVFGGKLVIGFGAAVAAVYTANLTTTAAVVNDAGSPAPLYIFAFTSDHASAYIAGGTAATDVNKVMASIDGASYQVASITVCDAQDYAITALAPGGGLGLLFVGKETELGTIDNNGLYRGLVPMDSSLNSNCRGMRWWLGTGTDEQRGPLIIVFPRDRSIWAYEPSSQTAGRAQNISPWADPQIRPPTVRGNITAIQGTARWLYYAVTNSSNESWLVARDARTGANHGAILDLGAAAATQMLGITSLFGNPRLFAGIGNNVVSMILPLDGEVPFDDLSCRFVASGTIDLPDMDLGFPDEDKVVLMVRVTADGLVAGTQTIKVYASYDGAAYVPLGIAETSPFVEIQLPTPQVVKRIGIRLKLETASSNATPKLLGVSVRMSLNTRLYRQWSFQGLLPAGSSPLLSDLSSNPYSDIKGLWSIREHGTPVTFIDRWNDVWEVRLLRMAEIERYSEIDRTPEMLVDVQLLQVRPGTDASSTFAAPAGSTTFFPISFPWTPFYSSVLSTTRIISIPAGAGTLYPRWIVTGPGRYLTLTGPHGETWSLDYELSAGETVTIDFDPTRKTVYSDATGDQFSRVVSGSTWWSIAAGDNSMTVLFGHTSSQSQVELTWQTPTTY